MGGPSVFVRPFLGADRQRIERAFPLPTRGEEGWRRFSGQRPCGVGSMEEGLVIVVEAADMLLGVELDADLLDEIDLGFEEVDMAFLIRHQLFEQVL